MASLSRPCREAAGKRKDPTVAPVKSATLSPAKLAAPHSSTARKSTGPCTAAGKRRIVLKALKRGRDSRAFRERLVRASGDVELFDCTNAQAHVSFQPVNLPVWRQAERLAREVCCPAKTAKRPGGFETKPRYPLESTDSFVTFLSRIQKRDLRTKLGRCSWLAPSRTLGF